MIEFTERQRGLLQGTILPASQGEWDWLQRNANAIVPDGKSKNRAIPPSIDEAPPPGLNKGDLSRTSPRSAETIQRASPEDATEERVRTAMGLDED